MQGNRMLMVGPQALFCSFTQSRALEVASDATVKPGALAACIGAEERPSLVPLGHDPVD